MARFVSMGPSGLPTRDPAARCDGCGTTGTVSRAYRTVDDVIEETYVYCAACWPEHQARLEARWREQMRLSIESRIAGHRDAGPAGGWGFETKTWHGVLQFVEQINNVLRATRPTPDQLKAIAAELASAGDDLDGPMPFAIQAFIREHSDAT